MGQFIIHFRKPRKTGRRPQEAEKSKPVSQSEADRRAAENAEDQGTGSRGEKASSGQQAVDGRPDV